MHGRMHPNYYQITMLLVVDLCSSLAYFMMTHPLPIAAKLPIKTLVARQLPTNACRYQILVAIILLFYNIIIIVHCCNNTLDKWVS